MSPPLRVVLRAVVCGEDTGVRRPKEEWLAGPVGSLEMLARIKRLGARKVGTLKGLVAVLRNLGRSSDDRRGPAPARSANLLLSPAGRQVSDLLISDARVPSVAELALRLQSLDIADVMNLGFSSFWGSAGITVELPVGRQPGGLPKGDFTMMLSSQHRALQWHEFASDQLRLWIDAHEIALPTDTAGDRMVEPSGDWVTDWLFAAQTLAADHPQQDFSKVSGTGQIRGLFVCDARTKETRLELPRDNEAWTLPLLRLRGKIVSLYADRAALGDNIPSREWATALADDEP